MKKKWLSPLVVLLAVCGSVFASEVVTEVIRMQKSGVDAPVLTAYVQKAGTFSLSADEIVELETAGVPSPVIVVMLDKDGPAADTVPEVNVAAATETGAVTATFTEALAPYGSWSDDKEYGRVFVPAEAVSDANWQPYVDNGTWVYTDQGWFWNSSYAWGWAPFHYGRWAHRDRWVWIPDDVWGPSWVSWRHNDNYYGWAPLTPRARFEVGVGFRFGSGNIDVSLGLGERDYFFVPSHSFLEVNLRSSGIRNEERGRIYGQTTIVNNYTVNNTTVINAGIPVASVAVATKQEVKPVAIAATQGKPGEKATASKVQGGKIEVFRPTMQAKATVSAVDKHVVDKTAKTETPRPNANANATAKTDTRKAEMAQRIRERAKTETPAQPKTTARTPEAKNDPVVKPPQERTTTAEAEHAKIEQAKKAREEREPKKNVEPETRNTVPKAREPQERQPEPKAERQPERKVEPRPEVKAEPRNEPKVEPKPEPREERKPEPRATEERRPAPQPQARDERLSPEPKEKREAK